MRQVIAAAGVGMLWLLLAYFLRRTGSLEIADWKWGIAGEGAKVSGDVLHFLAAVILFPGHVIAWLGGPGWLALACGIGGCFAWGWLTVKAASCLTTRWSGHEV